MLQDKLECEPGFEPRKTEVAAPRITALPLAQNTQIKLVEGTGVEPAYVRLKAGCSAAKPTLNKTENRIKIKLAGAKGIERHGPPRFNLRSQSPTLCQLSYTPIKLAGVTGIEPATSGVKVRRSAN